MSQNIIQPYRFGGGGNIDDTDLKAYWKFNEASGTIINVSESSDALTSESNITMSGGTYEDGSPLASGGNSVLFDGTDDTGVCSTNTSQFNFLHNVDFQWTICLWLILKSTGSIFGDSELTGGQGSGIRIRGDTPNPFEFNINSTNGNIINQNAPVGFVPDTTNWYFYCFRGDITLASGNLVARRNDSSEISNNKNANAPVNTDSANPFRFARNPKNNNLYCNFSEFSVWDKIMSAEDETALYNSGDGLEIY